MPKMQTETRTFNFEVRAEQNQEHGHFLTGVPVVYDTKTDIGLYDEIIARGALDHTDLKDVRFLIGHDYGMVPLARSRNNNENSTMQLRVTERGLEIRVDLDTENNSDSRKLYSAVQRGDISGMSFTFVVDDESWDDLDSDHPTRTIRSFKRVYEVSAVAYPAYAQTSLQARSQDAALDSARASLDSAKEKRAKEIAIEKLKKWRARK